MKDKSSKMIIATCKSDISEMLKDMEESRNDTLSEGDNHQDFAIDLLNALATVQDKSFMSALDKTQDSCDSVNIITNGSIIQQETAKHMKIISRNQV